MTYSRILIATDLSDEAAQAAQLALRLGHERAVYRVVLVRPEPWALLASAPRARRAQDAYTQVRDWAARVGVPDPQISVPIGGIARELGREAERFRADLVVVGDRGAGRAHPRLLGSVARSVLRGSSVDTLVARGGPIAEREPILTSILVATDFHEASEAAGDRAYQLAKQHESDVTLVHAIDPTLWYDPGLEAPSETANGWLEGEIQERLASFNADHLSGKAKELILHGRPGPIIAQAAREHDIDLVIIGDHGSSAIERAMIGSSAEAIAELAPTSVLVVRSGSL